MKSDGFRRKPGGKVTSAIDKVEKDDQLLHIAHFQPTLTATSAGLKPTIPANEPAFIYADLHSITPDPQ